MRRFVGRKTCVGRNVGNFHVGSCESTGDFKRQLRGQLRSWSILAGMVWIPLSWVMLVKGQVQGPITQCVLRNKQIQTQVLTGIIVLDSYRYVTQ
jgi:hypothetical protein